MGCSSEDEAVQGESTETTEQTDAVSSDMGATIAKVNGVEIKQKVLDSYLDNLFKSRGINAEQRKKIEEDPMFAEQKKQLMDVLIGTEAIRQEAAKSDVSKDPEVALKIKLQSDQILVEAYLTKLAEAKITDEQLKQNYEDIKLIQLRNDKIDTTTFEVASSDDSSALKELIDAAGDVTAKLTELNITGVAAQKTMMDYEADPNMKSNIEATPEGSFIGPVPSANGSTFIRVDKKTEDFLPFEDVKEGLKAMALQKTIPEIAEEIRNKADVTQFEDGKPAEKSSSTDESHSGHNH